jgi:hypothetical protein
MQSFGMIKQVVHREPPGLKGLIIKILIALRINAYTYMYVSSHSIMVGVIALMEWLLSK